MGLFRRCHFCKGARYVDCHLCDRAWGRPDDDCLLCVGGKAPCPDCEPSWNGAHAYAEYGVGRLGVIWPAAHWRCKRIHAAVDQAAPLLAGPMDPLAVLGVIVSTYVADRHVWYPRDAEPLVAAGIVADDGPVDGHPDQRWYRPSLEN